jgi:phosphatidylglycerol---prolipoprotein diacylglyceryl transferase
MPILALPFPMIDPVAIAIGPIAIRWYALAYVAGLLGGWFYARRLAAREALWRPLRAPTATDVDDLIVWVAFGVVLGGRLGYVLFYNLRAFLAEPLEIFAVWHGGMSFHGGLLGAILALMLFARSRNLNPLTMLDLAAVVTPIGLFFGRIANFVNGELWGRPAPDFPYAFVFPNGGPIPRHPSQLYEAFAEGLLLYFLLRWLMVNRCVGGGRIAGLFLVLYGGIRFFIEYVREPDAGLGTLVPMFTRGQELCLVMALLGVIVFLLSGRKADTGVPDAA